MFKRRRACLNDAWTARLVPVGHLKCTIAVYIKSCGAKRGVRANPSNPPCLRACNMVAAGCVLISCFIPEIQPLATGRARAPNSFFFF